MSEHMEMLKTLYDSANRESETPEAFIEIFTPRLKEALHDEAFLLFCMQNDMDVISLLSADSKYSKSQLNLEVMWHPTFSSLDALTQLEFIYQNRFYYPFLNEQGDKRYYASINPITQEDHLEYLRTRHIDDDYIGLMDHLITFIKDCFLHLGDVDVLFDNHTNFEDYIPGGVLRQIFAKHPLCRIHCAREYTLLLSDGDADRYL